MKPDRQGPWTSFNEGGQWSWKILALLIAYRLVNALSVRTFFQPDEYFQSLEPAWAMAFGPESGAWITWEWRYQIRSATYPALFALLYSLSSRLAGLLRLSLASRASLLVAMPKVLQALFAALGDFYTWKLAGLVYGKGSRVQGLTLAVTVLSPWQWFCSTRTLSNCVETTLTVIALNYWPWQTAPESQDQIQTTVARNHRSKPTRLAAMDLSVDAKARLRRSLTLAAVACVLRPTNVFIWTPLSFFALVYFRREVRYALFREAVLCGGAVLAVSVLLDRFYYGIWTLSVLRFLYYNIVQSLAVFYGTNVWHYYLSQGIPLLLTTALPFSLAGLCKGLAQNALLARASSLAGLRFQLAITVLFAVTLLSLVSHKEVRFIYPVLPMLHLFAAESLAGFLFPNGTQASKSRMPRVPPWKGFLVGGLLLANMAIAFYTTQFHQSGVVSVLEYLRHEHEHRQNVDSDPPFTQTYVGFLMPCHSTPWRSHLVHSNLRAWALSCEPPIDLGATDKATYLDEADQFYADPIAFIQDRLISPHEFRRLQNSRGGRNPNAVKVWPDYLVFFAQLEPTMRQFMAYHDDHGLAYDECWRGFNSHWHDDWRRRGDVVVWCSRRAAREEK